jgi:hypothetical protein
MFLPSVDPQKPPLLKRGLADPYAFFWRVFNHLRPAKNIPKAAKPVAVSASKGMGAAGPVTVKLSQNWGR